MGGGEMLQKLSEEIREYLRRAEECRRRAETALNTDVIRVYLVMEQRWLAQARSYGFTERLSTFVEPFQRETREDKETPSHGRRGRLPCRTSMRDRTSTRGRSKPIGASRLRSVRPLLRGTSASRRSRPRCN